MDESPDNSARSFQLGDEALERISLALSDLFETVYDEPATDPRATVSGSILTFSFSDGLAVSDEWLLRAGQGERLREFRRSLLEVVSDDVVGTVSRLTQAPVAHSFYDFDPTTRITIAVFVLGAWGTPAGIEDRKEPRRP